VIEEEKERGAPKGGTIKWNGKWLKKGTVKVTQLSVIYNWPQKVWK
jgi:hypothetical protein